jgi:hypothetical protein
MFRRFKIKYNYIEIVPPAFSDKTTLATESLFSALHGLGSARSFSEKLFGIRHSFTADIVSSRKLGIRFVIGVPEQLTVDATKLVQAYLSDAKTTLVDYSPTPNRVYNLRFTKHFAFPIKHHDFLEEDDPIGYITSAMTNLKDNEQIIYRVLMSPRKVQKAENISKKILKNDNFLPSSTLSNSLNPLLGGVNRFLFFLSDTVSSLFHGPSNHQVMTNQKEIDYKTQVAKDIKPVRSLSFFEHELVESVHDKLKRPLFKASVLLAVESAEPKQFKKALLSSLSLYSVPKYQTISYVRTLQSLARFRFRRTLQSKPTYLGASEIASLYHFPNSLSAKTENVIKSLSKTLPAPISLKNDTKLDVIIGNNKYHGSTTPIGLTDAERERHMYVIGGTGNGKTTMLLYQIVQDIRSGKGVAVIDPHGDLAETILGYIPIDRLDDVIYFNPDDLGHPIGLNLLELEEGLTGDDLLREKDLVTESTISVLRKIFSEDDSGGHRIEYVLRNTIQTALTLDSANLFTIFRLLNDAKYRKNIIKQLEDEDLKNFWKQELGKAGDFQRVKMAAGITAKIGRFLFSASAKRILEQEKSSINFNTLMDENKILICNFSKGLLGEDTSMLFGVTILAKLQLASLRRARQLQANRSAYYLYVDEFQNFATMSFVQMLSEARKYRLFLIMAEQSTSQQDDQRLVDIILANVGTVVAFRSGSPADERLILPLFYPFIDQGEIANLPSYTFYVRIAAIHSQEPMSGETLLLEVKPDIEVAKMAKFASQIKYGLKKVADEETVVTDKPPVKMIVNRKRQNTVPVEII